MSRRSTPRYVGFYGCSDVDRVVCVAAHEQEGPKVDLPRLRALRWKQECPGCGEVHVFVPLWRQSMDRDVGLPEVTVEPEAAIGV